MMMFATHYLALASLSAFACSLAASLKDLAEVIPDWIEVGDDGLLVRILEDKSPSLSTQVVE